MSDTAPAEGTANEAAQDDAAARAEAAAARAEALAAMGKGKAGKQHQRTDYVPLSAAEAAAGTPRRRPAHKATKPVDYQPYSVE